MWKQKHVRFAKPLDKAVPTGWVFSKPFKSRYQSNSEYGGLFVFRWAQIKNNNKREENQ